MALDLEEAQLGVSCVAAPVFGADRKVAAGLSVTGVTGSVDPGTLGPAVRTAAFTLSRLLRESGL
jgi:IclR family transcriptional regulator, acetate operon repressor